MQNRDIFVTIFFTVWTALSGYIVYQGFSELEGFLRARGWSTTKGHIVSSEVVDLREPGKQDENKGAFKALIKYTFNVDGIEYQGDRFAFGYYGNDSQFEARQLSSSYAPKSIVDIHFDPDNPQESVLYRGVRSDSIIKTLFGVVFLLAGLFGFRRAGKPIRDWKGSRLFRTKGGSVYGRRQ